MPSVGTLNEGLTRAGIHSSGHWLSKETDWAFEGKGRRETGKGSNGENRERRTELAVIPSGAPSGGGEESQSSRYRACLWPTAARVTSQSSDASGQSESAVCR